ncbi:MAG: hypothetical protein VB856_00345 [Rhodospirillales bacterium]|jgi:hypothetical protein
MHKSDYFNTVVEQCRYLNKIILEAENSQDLDQTVNLYITARSETNDLTKSLRLFLSEVKPDEKLKAA